MFHDTLSLALSYHLLKAYRDVAPHCTLQGVFSTAQVLLRSFADCGRQLPEGSPSKVIQAAQLAVGARFSSHAAITGNVTLSNPLHSLPSSLPNLPSVGRQRGAAVAVLAAKAQEAFRASSIGRLATLPSIMTLLVMDQLDLYQARTVGHSWEREYLDQAVKRLREYKAARGGIKQDKEDVVTRAVVEVDTARASSCGVPTLVTSWEIAQWLPGLAAPPSLPALNLAAVPRGTPEEPWIHLIPQLVPFSNYTTKLTRDAIRGPPSPEHPLDFEEYFRSTWGRADKGHTLTNSTQVQCLFLPALSTAEQTRNRAVALLRILNFFRRTLVTVDFILHRSLASAKSAGDPRFAALVARSHARVRSGFAVLVGMAKFVKQSQLVQQAKPLSHALNSSTDWADIISRPEESLPIIRRIGLSCEDCRALLEGLQYASWMSPCAGIQVQQFSVAMERLRLAGVATDELLPGSDSDRSWSASATVMLTPPSTDGGDGPPVARSLCT